jgi:exosortase/archaeosortase family protein
MKTAALIVLALILWCRDLSWLPRAEETLPALAGLPLFVLLARPRFAPKPSQNGLTLALALLVLGLSLDISLLLAGGFTALLAAILEPTPRTRLHLPLVFVAFPWLALEGQALGWWLRLSGAWATEHVLSCNGISIERVGTSLQLPGVTVGVDAPCAGLNVLQAALVGGLAVLLWDGRFSRLGQLPLVLATLVGLAWLANVLRLVMICGIALTYGAEVARGPLHEQSGLVVLVGVLTLLTYTGKRREH